MDSDRINFLREKSEDFDKYCCKKNIRKRLTQFSVLSLVWSSAVALPLYTYANTDHSAIQIGSVVYGSIIGILGSYYPIVVLERIDEEIFEEAEKLEQILDEEH
jgi:predicted DNA-binding transcriptional regulator